MKGYQYISLSLFILLLGTVVFANLTYENNGVIFNEVGIEGNEFIVKNSSLGDLVNEVGVENRSEMDDVQKNYVEVERFTLEPGLGKQRTVEVLDIRLVGINSAEGYAEYIINGKLYGLYKGESLNLGEGYRIQLDKVNVMDTHRYVKSTTDLGVWKLN